MSAEQLGVLTMKAFHFAIAAGALALTAGVANAQQAQPQTQVQPGSVTGDWNGAHAPTDDKQYQDQVTVPVGSTSAGAAAQSSAAPSSSYDVTASSATTSAPTATSYAQNASFTTMTLTNGPVPDTPQNRRKYGQPLSNAGKHTAARGN